MTDPLDKDDLYHAFLNGLSEAARIMCQFCRDHGEPKINERGVLAHTAYSSNNLATEHACRSAAIYHHREQEIKRHIAREHEPRRKSEPMDSAESVIRKIEAKWPDARITLEKRDRTCIGEGPWAAEIGETDFRPNEPPNHYRAGYGHTLAMALQAALDDDAGLEEGTDD